MKMTTRKYAKNRSPNEVRVPRNTIKKLKILPLLFIAKVIIFFYVYLNFRTGFLK